MSADCIDKIAIARSFGRAAQSYDSVAHFQRWVADGLIDKVPAQDYESIVDLGCGTGYSSSQLLGLSDSGQYLGVDLSSDMLSYAREHHGSDNKAWLTGDAEALPIKSASQDLVYSSLAIQWCTDLERMFTEVYRVLKPGGVFAFASLVDGSLSELKAAWRCVDEKQHVNEFETLADYERSASSTDFCIATLCVEAKVLRYEKVKDLTRELKLLGAHNITSQRPSNLTGKNRLKAFIEAYENCRMAEGYLPATYQVLWGVLVKP